MLFETWLEHSEGIIRRAAIRTGWTFCSRTVTRYGSIYVDYERLGESFREELRIRLADHVGRPWLRQMSIVWDRPNTVTRALNSFAQDRYPRGHKFTQLPAARSAAVGRAVPQVFLGPRGCGMPEDLTAAACRLGARHYWQPDKGVVDVLC